SRRDAADEVSIMTTEPITIVVLNKDLDDFTNIRAALNADSRAKLISGGNDPDQVYEVVVKHNPSAAIINLGASGEQAIGLIQRLKQDCPGTAIISAAKETSADLILQSLREGAKEFLRLPIEAEELKTVLDHIEASSSELSGTEKKNGQTIAVFSSKGGCGTSFIATNIAAAMNKRTVLIDLNFESGDLPLFLGIRAKYSVQDLVSHHGAIDDCLISSQITSCSKNLDLIAAPEEIDPVEQIKPEYILEVLQRLSECYDYVIIDPQHTFDAITLAALDQSTQIILVVTLDIPSIRSAQRTLRMFDRIGYQETKVQLLLNRWSKQADLDIPQVEEFLGRSFIGSITSDYQTVVNSINHGKPLVYSDPRSKIGREIKRVTKLISTEDEAVEETKSKRSWNLSLKRSRVAKA
ncbi:MAG: AAA family ATPase, partial [Acidobacteriota bacterium]